MVRLLNFSSKARERRIKQVLYYCMMQGLRIDKPLAIVSTGCIRSASAYGQCSKVQGGIVVELDHTLKGRQLVGILAHELKHGEQYCLGHLTVKGKRFFWKGKPCPTNPTACPAEKAADRYGLKIVSALYPSSNP